MTMIDTMFGNALADALIKDALPELEKAAAILARHADRFDAISEVALHRYAASIRTIVKLQRRPVKVAPQRVELAAEEVRRMVGADRGELETDGPARRNLCQESPF